MPERQEAPPRPQATGEAEAYEGDPEPEGEEESAGRNGDDGKEAIGDIARNIGGIASDLGRLVSLETRSAAMGLAQILALGVIGGAVVVIAWASLSGALAIALVQYELFGPALALVAIGGVNLLLALVVYVAARRLSRALTFRHSRAALGEFLTHGQEDHGDRN